MKRLRIASFLVDHTRLKPGLYVSRIDRYSSSPITTFDLRLIPPNSEIKKPLDSAAMHTIEHIGATFLRNDAAWGKNIVYFGPMGCRTGFYLLVAGSFKRADEMIQVADRQVTSVLDLVKKLCWYVMSYTSEIPGATPEECGNYRDHNLLGAKMAMHNYYTILAQTSEELGYDQFAYPE